MAQAPTAIATASQNPALDRLVYFEVKGIFQEFTYRIPINTEKRVTAIIAPNGSGKTICLRLINSLFQQQWSFFADIDFERTEYHFESGHRVCVTHEPKGTDPDEALNSLGLAFAVVTPNGETSVWRPGSSDPKVARSLPIERYLSFLTRRSLNQFVHDYTGANYTLLEAVETFSSSLPPTFRSALYGDEPPQLRKLIKNIDCHLIETQRLLILKDENEDSYRSARGQRSSLAISKKAQTLKSVIAKDLTAYAALSQSLDRSFPKRVCQTSRHVRKVPIVLQNSKVAAVKIFGENLKRKEVDDSHSFSRATEVAHEFGARR